MGLRPFTLHTAREVGRGLFASRDIKIGELVRDGGKSDIILTWTQGGELRTCMDIAILMNAANWKSENKTEPNLNANVEMYATRDIKKGEELLYNYGNKDQDWKSVGL